MIEHGLQLYHPILQISNQKIPSIIKLKGFASLMIICRPGLTTIGSNIEGEFLYTCTLSRQYI